MSNLVKKSAGILTLTFLVGAITSTTAFAFGSKPVTPPPPPPPPVQEPEVIRARWEASQRDGALWSKHVFQQLSVLGKDLLASNPSDIAQFCENYPNLNADDKKNFWVYLISSMSELESSHKPETKYQEAFNDQNGNPVISRGLLQISIESGNAYGCAFTSEQQLHDPYLNLNCGIRILNRWIKNDRRLAGKSGSTWQGGARYWSVLRNETPLNKIRSWVQAQQICWVR